MTLTLHLAPALETRLKARAIREGRAEEEIILNAVEKFLAAAETPAQHHRSAREFRGAGKHNPIGGDAQEYINAMRDEWDRQL